MNSNNIQDDALAKEEMRIKHKQQIYAQRRDRIHNAKTRMFGIDVQALDAQMAEKRNQKNRDTDLENYEKMQALEIERMLAQSLEEERQMKEFQLQQMRASWETEIARKKAEAARPKTPEFDIANSGPASLQQMEGIDVQKAEREEMQKRQMREWIMEQIAEKEYCKQLDKEDDMNYAELIRTIDEIREATEREEHEMRKYITDTIKLENLELSRAQNSRRKFQNAISDENNGAISTSLQVFNENEELSMDEHGRIVRKDMFRGLTKAQKQRIFEENQQIMRDNMARRKMEQENDDEWLHQQQMAMRAMEQSEYKDKLLKLKLKEEHLAYLRGQIEQQAKSTKEWTSLTDGGISNEFYEKFGKDHR